MKIEHRKYHNIIENINVSNIWNDALLTVVYLFNFNVPFHMAKYHALENFFDQKLKWLYFIRFNPRPLVEDNSVKHIPNVA